MESYGQELILDLHECNPKTFNRTTIRKFCRELCRRIGMQAEDLYFWDYRGHKDLYEKAPNHLKGTSAVQFIRTSNITIHTLDVSGNIYLNVFSCRSFDHNEAISCAVGFFGGKVAKMHILERL